MWFMLMLPAADLLSHRRWSRGVGLVLLALSVLAASYPTWNAWTPALDHEFPGLPGVVLISILPIFPRHVHWEPPFSSAESSCIVAEILSQFPRLSTDEQ